LVSGIPNPPAFLRVLVLTGEDRSLASAFYDSDIHRSLPWIVNDNILYKDEFLEAGVKVYFSGFEPGFPPSRE
jgi:hypothetical protein